MFRRVRIIANGSAVIEDIEEYGRVFQMFSELMPSQRRFNAVSETWGSAADGSLGAPDAPEAIPAVSGRTMVVQLLSSFLTQDAALVDASVDSRDRVG